MKIINADKLYAQYQDLCRGIACVSCPFLNIEDNKCELESMILQLPTVDVEPVEFEWCHDCKEYDQEAHCCHRWTKVIRNTVNDLKTQGYEMVTHGHWINDTKFGADVMSGEQMVICSVCGRGIFWGRQNYCPNCGARMDEKGE